MNEIQVRLKQLHELKTLKKRLLTITGSLYLFAILVFSISTILAYGAHVKYPEDAKAPVMAVFLILFFGSIFARVPVWFAVNKNKPKFEAINEYDKKNVKYYNGALNYSIAVWLTLFAITPIMEILIISTIYRTSKDIKELEAKGVEVKVSDATLQDYKNLLFQKTKFKKVFVPIMFLLTIVLIVPMFIFGFKSALLNSHGENEHLANIYLSLTIFCMLSLVFSWIAYALTNRVLARKLITLVQLLLDEKKMPENELIDFFAYRKVEKQNGNRWMYFGSSFTAARYYIDVPFTRKEIEKYGEALLMNARQRAHELDDYRSTNYHGWKRFAKFICDPFNVITPGEVLIEGKQLSGSIKQTSAILFMNAITYFIIGGAIAAVLPILLDNFTDGIGIAAVASLWVIMIFSFWIRRFETSKKHYNKLDWTDTLKVDVATSILTISIATTLLVILYTN